MIIAPPAADDHPTAPPLGMPTALANATAAAHQAAAIAADGEFHRATRSVTPAPADDNWSPVGAELRAPIEMYGPVGTEFGSDEVRDGVIEGMVAVSKPSPSPAKRSYERRRRIVLLVFLVLAVLVLIAGQLLHRDEDSAAAAARSVAAAGGSGPIA